MEKTEGVESERGLIDDFFYELYKKRPLDLLTIYRTFSEMMPRNWNLVLSSDDMLSIADYFRYWARKPLIERFPLRMIIVTTSRKYYVKTEALIAGDVISGFWILDIEREEIAPE